MNRYKPPSLEKARETNALRQDPETADGQLRWETASITREVLFQSFVMTAKAVGAVTFTVLMSFAVEWIRRLV